MTMAHECEEVRGSDGTSVLRPRFAESERESQRRE
jgi:hypothetical protein